MQPIHQGPGEGGTAPVAGLCKRGGAGAAFAAGFTLLETLIATTILLMMVFMVATLSDSGSAAQRYAGRITRATELGQDIVTEMRRLVASSVRLFHDDVDGRGYLSIVDLPFSGTRLAGRLPQLRSMAIFERETGAPITGNILLFARHAWTDTYACLTSGNSYGLDVYRICCYYLRPDGDGLVPGSMFGLNLCRYTSEPMVAGEQIDAITDAGDRAEVLQNLLKGRTTADSIAQPVPIHSEVQVVWRVNGAPTALGTLREIDPGTLTLSDNPLPPRPANWVIARNLPLTNDGLLQFRHFSVATVWSPDSFGVGRFSQVATNGEGFPHGFEVQAIGPAAARQVLLRLTIVSTVRSSLPAWTTTEIIQDCRDI